MIFLQLQKYAIFSLENAVFPKSFENVVFSIMKI